MRKILHFILFFCFLSIPLFAAREQAGLLHLKEKLAESKPGSYFVTEQSKMFTFLFIHDRTERAVVIEEVTIPQARFAKNSLKWKEWFERGAPGHTSWLISQIDLKSARFEESFSFTHKGWIDMSGSNSFLTTLLNLHFRPVPDSQRRRVGAAPTQGSRPVWNPRLTVNGRTIARIPFTAWKTRWPSDGTELSRKLITIYLPEKIDNPSIPAYPTCFPYWFEVDGKIGSAKVRVVDSGTDAHSPKGGLPLRPPKLIGQGKLKEEGLVFHLQSPSYYKEFILIAEETSSFGNAFPLRSYVSPLDNKTIALTVPREEIEKFMQPGGNYRFMMTPKEAPSICIETEFNGL